MAAAPMLWICHVSPVSRKPSLTCCTDVKGSKSVMSNSHVSLCFFLPLSLCLSVSVFVQGFNKDAVREIALLQELSRHPNIVTLREVVLQPDVRSPICTQGREGDAFGAILVTQIPSFECFGAAIPRIPRSFFATLNPKP